MQNESYTHLAGYHFRNGKAVLPEREAVLPEQEGSTSGVAGSTSGAGRQNLQAC